MRRTAVANVFTMDPSRLPYIVNGPPCTCTHRRLAHVGAHPQYGVRAADLACTECNICEKYTPVEAVDLVAEGEQHEQIRRLERRSGEISRNISFALAGCLLLVAVLALWNRDVFAWAFVPVVLASTANYASIVINSYRRGEEETFGLILNLGLCVLVAVFMISVVTKPPAIVSVALLAGLLLGSSVMVWRMHRDIFRRRQELNTLQNYLKKRGSVMTIEHTSISLRLQVFDGQVSVYDRTVNSSEYPRGQLEQGDAAERIRRGGRPARVLITDPTDGTKLYEDIWNP